VLKDYMNVVYSSGSLYIMTFHATVSRIFLLKISASNLDI